MKSGLAHRLEDIPGVASVTVDLTEEGGGITIRLTPWADESEVMEKLRTVLIAYRIRGSQLEPTVRSHREPEPWDPGAQVRITPLEQGARIEVETRNVRSFRIVAADPMAIAQGIADAWCQVTGRVSREIVGLSVGEDGEITVSARDGEAETTGSASVEAGWESALTLAVGRAIGTVPVTSTRRVPFEPQSDPTTT